jgi:hypothetical protein
MDPENAIGGPNPRNPAKTYPGAIWLGPGIIAVNSPADRTRPRDKILAEAKMAWDREHFVSKLADKLWPSSGGGIPER